MYHIFHSILYHILDICDEKKKCYLHFGILCGYFSRIDFFSFLKRATYPYKIYMYPNLSCIFTRYTLLFYYNTECTNVGVRYIFYIIKFEINQIRRRIPLFGSCLIVFKIYNFQEGCIFLFF